MARPHYYKPLVFVSFGDVLLLFHFFFFTLEFVIVVVDFFWAFFLFPFISPLLFLFFLWTHLTQFLAATRTQGLLETTVLELSLLISLICLNPPLIYAKKKQKKTKKNQSFPRRNSGAVQLHMDHNHQATSSLLLLLILLLLLFWMRENYLHSCHQS